MDAVFLESFERLLDQSCPAVRAREIEAGCSIAPSWNMIERSGFLDLLVSESDGGGGLSLAEAAPLLRAVGQRALPLPIAETMVARALMSTNERATIDGPITLATCASVAPVPLSLVAAHVLVDRGGPLKLQPITDIAWRRVEAYGDLSAFPDWASDTAHGTPAGLLSRAAAVLRSTLIAGAAEAALKTTIAYANERAQFGKPIGRQQAIQNQLAVAAEQAAAASVAADLGCREGLAPSVSRAAVAKQVASDAAGVIADVVHAVHGAIGISAEFHLQRLTRALRMWRLADGGGAYWAQQLGLQRFARPHLSSVDFAREAADVVINQR